MIITKETLFNEFKDATNKDLKSKKPSFTNRINYLKQLKIDFDKSPRNFSNVNISSEQIQNLIDSWSAPNPRDAFYQKVFNMTYAEKKAEEEAEYYDLDSGQKVYMKKKIEDTDNIH